MFWVQKTAETGTVAKVENCVETIADSSTDHLRARTRPGQLLPGIDGRSAWTRRCQSYITAHITDLGGVENCSAAERSIIRRAAVLTTELERMERQFALDEQASPDDLETYQRCANSLRRLLESVGLQRRARNVNELSLSDIQAEYAQRNAGAAP
jgi:hypothetical protein